MVCVPSECDKGLDTIVSIESSHWCHADDSLMLFPKIDTNNLQFIIDTQAYISINLWIGT